MALMHLLPEAVELYGDWVASKQIGNPFPLPYLLFLSGILLVLLVDRVIAKYITGGDHHAMGKKEESEVEMANEMANEMAEGGSETANGSENAQKPQEAKKVEQTAKVSDEETAEANKGVAQEKDAAETVSKTSAVILVIAIGFHAVFEGIAFGLMTEINNAG